jgi:hypothetical protein
MFSALAAAAVLAGCAPTLGPPPPGGHRPSPGASSFKAEDFAWSTEPGRGGIAGRVTYRRGPTRFVCTGATVILTPETPWTRRRMKILYGSTEQAAESADTVRARTPSAPDGDYSAYVRRATCDGANHFSFSKLPDGAWYVITIARPAGGQGQSVALMRRVVTKGGRPTPATL